jgi:hypothetical protein
MVRLKVIGILLAILLLFSGTTWGYQLISTYVAWNGSSYISSWGVTDTATYGQLLIVPGRENSLKFFSFSINDLGVAITYRAMIYNWDSSSQHATGSPLFQTGPMTTVGADRYERYTFTIPGGLNVTPGQQLILLATTSFDQAGAPASAARWGSTKNDASYPEGRFYFLNNNNNSAALTTTAWSVISDDLAFAASFGDYNYVTAPTLSNPMLILLTLLFGITGYLLLRRFS